MTLQSIIDGAREFVAGVRALPRIAAAQTRIAENHVDKICHQQDELDQERAAHEETKRKLTNTTWNKEDYRHRCDALVEKLESERAARQKAEAELAEERASSNKALVDLDSELSLERAALTRYTNQHRETCKKLTSALETIDALTRFRDGPCPVNGHWFELEDHTGVSQTKDVSRYPMGTKWRYTPESWEAARKAGTDGK